MSEWGLFRRHARDAAEGPWTVLSAGTRARGELRGRRRVRIEGSFEGTVQIEGVLHIGPAAVVTGELAASHIIVEGQVEGSLAAAGPVEFRATANLRGDTRAGRVAVEDGAIVNGQIAMTEEPAPTRSPEELVGSSRPGGPGWPA